MSALIDVDQLRTFIAIAETGSFTKAAEVVHKTQSAVSMQMKRLEERLGKPIFARDGRASKLTEDGERLLDYARRIIKLNVEALAAFDDEELHGRVRLGLPDDYADRYLPEIMARFSRAYPSVELTVICEPSVDLLERIDANELDLAIITNCGTIARVGSLPPRAAAVGDVEPAFDAPGGTAAAGARPADLRLAARRDRMPGDDRPAASHRLHERQRRRGRRRGAVGAGGFGACRNPACGPACACSAPPTDFPNCRAAASAWCAIRMRAWRSPTRWPSTSSRRSTTFRKRRRRRSSFARRTALGHHAERAKRARTRDPDGLLDAHP